MALSTSTTRIPLALALLAAIAVASVDPAAAAPCGKREDVVRFLDSNYKERPEAMGMSGDNRLVEIYVSETGSWTIVMSMPGGHSCIIGAGEAWQQLPKAPGPNV